MQLEGHDHIHLHRYECLLDQLFLRNTFATPFLQALSFSALTSLYQLSAQSELPNVAACFSMSNCIPYPNLFGSTIPPHHVCDVLFL